MTTQTEKARKIGMLQPNYSKWCKKIANDIDSIVKGEALRVMKSEGLKIKIIKDGKKCL